MYFFKLDTKELCSTLYVKKEDLECKEMFNGRKILSGQSTGKAPHGLALAVGSLKAPANLISEMTCSQMNMDLN